jgi:hypothetical protein
MDGFEHIYTLRTGDGQGLGIQVSRDKVALEAAIAARESRVANTGITVTPGQIYEDFAELLINRRRPRRRGRSRPPSPALEVRIVGSASMGKQTVS